jgi:mycothiol synthase
MDTMTDTLSVAVPDAPPIPGLRFRRFAGEADFSAFARILRDGSLADGLDFVIDAENLRVEMETDPTSDLATDVIVALVGDEVVAFGQASRAVRDEMTVYSTGGSVHPDWRRRHLGRAILRWSEAHLRAKAEGFDDPGGRVLGTWIGEKESGAPELMASEGYVPVRYYFSMIRPSLDDLPAAELPDGLEIRDVEADQHRAIFDADAEAFRDHWGHREPTEEDFVRTFSMPDLDTSLWSVAWEGDEVAGSVQTFIWKAENEALGVRRGWLEHISVRRPWRRRGVAKAIIADALARLREAGMTEAMLGVDSENPTGALQLYENLGFRVKDRGIAFRKPWEPGGRLV